MRPIAPALTGDRLTAVNGAAVASAAELRALLGRLRVGDTVRGDVERRRAVSHRRRGARLRSAGRADRGNP